MTVYQDGGRWRYRFWFKNKRYGGSAPTGSNIKKTAEKLEREHIKKLEDRTFTGKMPTVEQFASRYLEYQSPPRVKPLTAELHTDIVNINIVPHIGTRYLDDVGAEALDTLISTWSKTAKPRTINTRLGVVARMLSLAKEWGYLNSIPKVKGIRIAKDTPRFLSFEEAGRLVEATKKNWRTMVFVALRTGLRVGELRGLQWGDVDLDSGSIHVRRTDPGRPDMEANAPKSNEERVIAMTPDTLVMMRAMHDAAVGVRRSHDWVWPGLPWRGKQQHRPRSEGGCVKVIRASATRAGLKGVTWHTLRHTYASWLVMRGTPIRVVQKLLGHASVKQTERYSHLAPDFAMHAAVASIDFAISPGPQESNQPVAKRLSRGTRKTNDAE